MEIFYDWTWSLWRTQCVPVCRGTMVEQTAMIVKMIHLHGRNDSTKKKTKQQQRRQLKHYIDDDLLIWLAICWSYHCEKINVDFRFLNVRHRHEIGSNKNFAGKICCYKRKKSMNQNLSGW